MNYIEKYISQFDSIEILKKDLNGRIKAAALKFEKEFPKISIVVPSFNQGKFLKKTILSILLQDYSNYEIILMDGGSSDNSIDVIKTYSQYLKYWVSEKDEGQSDAINKGLTQVSGEIFNWLNSDDYLEENALKKLADAYKLNKNAAGWVGACRRIDENNKTINVIYPNNLDRENIGQNWNGRQFYQPSCFLNAKFVKELNGVDKTLNAPFDLDLWIRILEKGEFKIGKGIWANALIHSGAKTQAARESMFLETVYVQNKYSFFEGAQNRYNRIFLNAKLEFILTSEIKKNLDANRSFDLENHSEKYINKKIIFISNYLPRFDRASANKRVYEVLKILLSEGFDITYIYKNSTPDDERYKSALKGNIKFVQLEFYVDKYLYEITSANASYIWVTNLWDVTYFSFINDLVDKIKRKFAAKIIIDTMDFHYKKFIRRYNLSNDKEDLRIAEEFLINEEKLYPNADVVITVTENEKEDIKEKIHGAKRIEVLPNIHEENTRGRSFTERNNICFLGNFNVNHNADAALFFINEILPIINRFLPGVEFHLIGNNAEKFANEFTRPNVKIIGYVENLDEVLSNYKLFVCPMIYGAGLKGKIGEAAAAGLPIVTTSIGAEGFKFKDGEDCFISDEPEEFAHKCLHLLNDPICWSNFNIKSKLYILKNFGTITVSRKLNNLFYSLSETITQNIAGKERVVRAGQLNLFNSDILKINWVLTRKCNYTCSYCPVYDNVNGFFPSIENLKKAVDQISKLNRSKYIITLTGGEPTIHPKFTELLKYIVDTLNDNVTVVIITNLSRTPRFFNDLCDNLKGYENYMSFVASYHFEFAEKDKYLENAKILSSNGFGIHLSILAHPDHIELVKSLESELKKIKNGKLNYELIMVRQDYGSEPDKRYKKDDLQWLKELYNNSKENKKIIIDWENDNNEIGRKTYSTSEITAKGINKFKGMVCNAGKNMISINGNGDIDKAVCFRGLNGNKKNIYNNENAIDESTKPVICPFENCACNADLQIPKFIPGYEVSINDVGKKNEDNYNTLKQKLDSVAWQKKYEFYKKDFEYTECLKKVNKPAVSIIVISWRLHPDTIKNFQILSQEKDVNYELIFVNNGGKENEFDNLKSFINTYIKLNKNTGAYVARNIGAVFAKAPVLLFLEDDGIPADDFLKSHIYIHNNYNIIALRGVYLPKTNNPLNNIQKHYNLGDLPVPYYLNLEGNLSIKNKNFFEVGGFSDEIIYGYGGADLAYKLKARNPEIEPSWYFPQPKIYHDYTYDSAALENKINVQETSHAKLIQKYPGFDKFLEYYRLNYEILQIEKNINELNHTRKAQELLESYKITTGELHKRLEKVGWFNKTGTYINVFKSVEYLNTIVSPQISIVVISWRLHKDTTKNFAILNEQRGKNFELIFVNNGANEKEFEAVKKYADTYITLNENTGAYLARNIGTVFANAPILFFLEDDGIPEKNILEAHLNAHRLYDVIAVRGVYIPKTNSPLNQYQSHYHLGNKPFPIYTDLEGNTTYKAETFFKVGGWDDEIKFGGGGVDLSIRLTEIEQDKRKQIYIPDAVIYHDFAKDENHLKNKLAKQEESRKRLRAKHPNWDQFIESWQVYNGKEITLIQKQNDTVLISNEDIFISICIPTYNQAYLITAAVQSALNQTYKNFEIVIVDDGSNDNTGEVIRNINSHKIKYIKKEHTNAADTRNRAIKESKGEFILWLDSDDLIVPNILEEYARTLNSYPDIDLLYCSLQAMKMNGEVFYIYDYQDYYKKNDAMLRFLFKGQPIPNGGTLIRKNIYDEVGYFNTEFKRAHDYEFYSRLVQMQKYNAKYVNKILYTYRVHDNNITLNTSGKINYEYERRIFKSLIAGNNYKIFFPDIDWNTNPKIAEAIAKLKIGLRYYELEGFEESINYLIQFFEIDRDEKNFIDIVNKFANDCNFVHAKNLIDNLNGISTYFPNYNQVKQIIDDAVLQAENTEI